MNINQNLNNQLTYSGSTNQFSDIFNLEEIQRLQDLFAEANGVASIITLPNGTPITQPSKFTRFCSDIIRGTEKGCLNCYKSDQKIGYYNPDGPVIQICDSGGLWDAGSGIIVDGKHIANWMIGQVRNEEIDEKRMIQYANEIGANGEEFLLALNEVPFMAVDQFNKVSNLMFEFAKYLSEKAYNNLQLKVQITEHEKAIELLQNNEDGAQLLFNKSSMGYKSPDLNSERNWAEVALRESEENMRYIIKHDPNAIAIYDYNLHYIAVSERYLHDYDVNEEDIIGKLHYEVFPEIPQKWKDIHQRCLAGAIERNDDDCFERPDGSITYNRWECRPWHRLNGKIGGIILYTEVTTGRKKAEEELLESEIKYRAFFENSMDAILLTSPDGKTLAVNQAACSMFGYSEDELIRLGRFGVEDATDYRLSVLLAERKLKGKALGEVTFIRKNGTRFSAEISTSVFKNKEGFDRASMIIRDISERKKIHHEIKFQTDLLNNVGQAVIATDAKNNVTYWNNAAEKIYGWSSEEALGQNIINLTPTQATKEQDDEIMKEISEGHTWSGEFLIKRKDGSNFSAYVTDAPILDPQGKLTGVIGISSDITERKFIEEALQVSEERFRHSFDYAASGICLVGIDGKFQRINNAFKEMIGYDEEELKNLTFTDITYPDDISIGLSQLKKLLNGEIDHVSFEKRYLRKDNSIIWTYLSTSLIRNLKHESQFFITQLIDITERKQSEKEIAMLVHSLKSINECVSITDMDDKIIFVNESFSRTYGYDMTELIGKQVGIIRSKTNKQKLVKEISQATIRGEWQGEILNIKKDGSEFPVFLSTSTIKDKENNVLGLIGVATDITERKLAEESLLKLSSAIEQTVDTIVITDRNGTIEYVNHAFEVLTGYSLKEALGKTPRILKSGQKGQKYYEAMWKTILSGKVYRQEVVNKKKNGDLYEEEKTISPIFDKNKIITHFVGTGVDITERKLAEKELIKAKERAEGSDRLKSAFLANMSHEVRTPLNSIIGFSQLLADPNFEEEQKNEFIQHIINNGNNLLTIISDIMDISKLESGEITIRKTQINVQKFISSIKEQFSFQAEANKLEFKLILPDTDEKTLIFGDEERLSQIFNNLVSNALKFTENGRIEIGYHLYHKMAEFYVRDTGIGIPTEYHDKIFERFIQVEAEKTRKYGGNGLGLAISKNLVGLMGGKIWVESEPGKGSVFYFTMPTY